MKPSRLPNWTYLLAIFLSGAILGAFGHRLYTLSSVTASKSTSPEEYRRKYVEELRTRLKLTDEQSNQLQPIMDETSERYRAFHERTKPELQAIHDEHVRKVNAILTDTQRSEYAKMREEREKRRQQRQKHPGF